jgi:hypothetical protein
MRKVHASEDAPTQASVLPERVQAALGDLVGAANVKRWQSGEMCLRWTAAAVLEAERQSGGSLAMTISPSSPSPSNARSPSPPSPPRHTPPRRPLRSSPSDNHTRTATKVPRRPGHPHHPCSARFVVMPWLLT